MKQTLFTTLFAVIICLLGACGNKGNADTAQNRPEAREVCTKDSIEAADSQEAQHAPESTEEICRERVEKFTKQQGIVVASFPDDSRYSVYYCKTDEYGRKFLYHYDAVSDSSEKMQLPINATGGEHAHHRMPVGKTQRRGLHSGAGQLHQRVGGPMHGRQGICLQRLLLQ